MAENIFSRLLLNSKILVERNRNTLRTFRSRAIEKEDMNNPFYRFNITKKSTCKVCRLKKGVPIPGVEPGPPR